MTLLALKKWVLGGLLGIAFVGIPACSTTSTEKPSAFTGQSQKHGGHHYGFPSKSNYPPR